MDELSDIDTKRRLPGLHYATTAEIETELATLFTPEQRAEIAATDISHIPPHHTTAAQMLAEDREDRVL